jgi:two-component system sensor histidine kinase UhpB
MNRLVLSLRTRLMVAIALALIAGLGLGCVITVHQARHSVAREMGSAFAVGRQTLTTVVRDLGSSLDPPVRLRQTIAAFDGNRHIRVSLIGEDDTLLDSSTLASSTKPAPPWFVSLIGVPARMEELPLPTFAAPFRAIRLETNPNNEVLEAWTPFREATVLISLLFLMSGVVIWWSITFALRPLATVSAALKSVGAGEFEARLPIGGPAETQVIVHAFNRMTQDLSVARDRNHGLYRQLLSAQEAERKDIARDLHDDIGPLLLSIIIDVAALEIGFSKNEDTQAVLSLQSIAKTVGEAQQLIRAIVNRLRPIGLAEFGVRRAVENLVIFWKRRHPAVTFDLDLDQSFDSLGEQLDLTVFRIVQEALVNALRHGQPTRIGVSFRPAPDSAPEVVVEVVDDGKGTACITPGFGLTGMRERVESAGGRLTTLSQPGGGFIMRAILPEPKPLAVQPAQLTEIPL